MARIRGMYKPFSVREFNDMLRILEMQLEWRSRMRRALFPEIDVPKALEKLAESTEAILATLRDTRLDSANLAKGQATIQQDMQDLKAGQQELFQRTDRLETGQQEFCQELHEVKTDVSVLKTDVSVLKTDVSVLKTDVSVLKTDVSVLKTEVREIKKDMGVMRTDVDNLKGKVHEAFYRDKAGAIFGVYLRGGREVTNQIADQLHDAVISGVITQDEFIQVLAADLLWVDERAPMVRNLCL